MQLRFKRDVESLVTHIKDIRNALEEDFLEIFTLNTKDTIDS